MSGSSSTEFLARIALDRAASEDAPAVAAALTHLGISADPETIAEQRSGVAGWVVQIIIAVPIGVFFSTLAAEFGKDVYARLKRAAAEIAEARTRTEARPGSMDLFDVDGTQLSLPAPIPDEALYALAHVNWEVHRGGSLVWDDRSQRWVDAARHPGEARWFQ